MGTYSAMDGRILPKGDRMTRRSLTPAQLEARDARRAQFRTLAQQVAALTEQQRGAMAAQMAGAVTVEGRQLSIHNACLLACQYPNATLVGGFRQWLSHGRQVRKGEHGLMIWAPIRGKANGNAPTVTDLDSERPHFIMVTVFDVSQTDKSA